MIPGGPAESSSASERLARTRLAILDYLQERQAGTRTRADAQDGPRHAGSGWRGLREAGQRYWHGHPARLVVRLAAPLLAHWGRRHPLAFIGIAAAAGALLLLARPWRLISATGLLVAALKSPHLASLAMTALASGRAGLRRRPRP
ncbi:MAG: hypothetical protein RIS88_2418 [Pseudomonadota bacterium]|jgi:hypothetical protein